VGAGLPLAAAVNVAFPPLTLCDIGLRVTTGAVFTVKVAAPLVAVPHEFVTTAFELPGFRIKRNLGIVRGIVVRSRSIVGTIGASLQTIVGGNISLFSKLCEQTRNDAFDLMLQHAEALGANAVIGVRYDATEIMQGVTEVLSYGTAVEVVPIPK